MGVYGLKLCAVCYNVNRQAIHDTAIVTKLALHNTFKMSLHIGRNGCLNECSKRLNKHRIANEVCKFTPHIHYFRLYQSDALSLIIYTQISGWDLLLHRCQLTRIALQHCVQEKNVYLCHKYSYIYEDSL